MDAFTVIDEWEYQQPEGDIKVNQGAEDSHDDAFHF
eukprot:CAMPEP_0168343162 /NCGR_PEP_ID=MMETSP0213-20121227/15885_1 /TAXON_ID=151035 /ORGANISM="Euplotes harpa, Strain FSP1.4" /LENGTH=35 /DNA_ID= /DNA_START= /DNA_END= /DNA_ORIENTATION=